MRWSETEKKQEVVIYGILWLVVLALVPVVMYFQGHSMGLTFRFADVLRIWLGIFPFFVLFLLHDLLAAPLWVEKGKPWAYLAVTAALLAVFGGCLWTARRDPGPRRPDGPPMEWMGEPPPPREEMPGPRPPMDGRMPLSPELLKFLLGVLLLGVNLGVKYYLKSARGERRMQELQAENLSRQLETLRYQINPHFFMNTLNNIHALVDIDPEQAKVSIEEFSKLMRHVLYEGDRPTIPLAKEMDFLRHYVSLMKMRYADTVRIDLSLPEAAGGPKFRRSCWLRSWKMPSSTESAMTSPLSCISPYRWRRERSFSGARTAGRTRPGCTATGWAWRMSGAGWTFFTGTDIPCISTRARMSMTSSCCFRRR